MIVPAQNEGIILAKRYCRKEMPAAIAADRSHPAIVIL